MGILDKFDNIKVDLFDSEDKVFFNKTHINFTDALNIYNNIIDFHTKNNFNFEFYGKSYNSSKTIETIKINITSLKNIYCFRIIKYIEKKYDVKLEFIENQIDMKNFTNYQQITGLINKSKINWNDLSLIQSKKRIASYIKFSNNNILIDIHNNSIYFYNIEKDGFFGYYKRTILDFLKLIANFSNTTIQTSKDIVENYDRSFIQYNIKYKLKSETINYIQANKKDNRFKINFTEKIQAELFFQKYLADLENYLWCEDYDKIIKDLKQYMTDNNSTYTIKNKVIIIKKFICITNKIDANKKQAIHNIFKLLEHFEKLNMKDGYILKRFDYKYPTCEYKLFSNVEKIKTIKININGSIKITFKENTYANQFESDYLKGLFNEI